jgi:hypothetical protein
MWDKNAGKIISGPKITGKMLICQVIASMLGKRNILITFVNEKPLPILVKRCGIDSSYVRRCCFPQGCDGGFQWVYCA